jgi:hypothetical protein
MILQDLLSTPDGEVLVAAEMRIEGGDLLLAFGDEDAAA